VTPQRAFVEDVSFAIGLKGLREAPDCTPPRSRSGDCTNVNSAGFERRAMLCTRAMCLCPPEESRNTTTSPRLYVFDARARFRRTS